MTTSYSDLKNRRVLVTGASGGLGAAMALAFAQQGARVIVHYRSRTAGAAEVCERIRQAGGQAEMLYADLRSEAALEALLERAWAIWDGVDVLINNAGVVLKASNLDTTAAHWDDVFNINLKAPFLLSRALVSRWLAAGHCSGTGSQPSRQSGCIIHNSSIHAQRSVEHFAAYAASKAALDQLTQVQALEWAPHGIRVNAVSPGVVPVERTQQALAAAEPQWLPHLPLGRYGAPDDIAQLTVFLASSAASWITGQSLVADGGMLARSNMPQRPQPPAPPLPEPVDDQTYGPLSN